MKPIRLNASGVEAAIDPSCFEEVPKDRIISADNCNFVSISSEELLKNSTFIQKLLSDSVWPRINLFSENLERVLYSLNEVSAQTYSWFIFFGPKGKSEQSGLHNQQLAKETVTSSLTESEKTFLRASWKRDYIDSVLASHGDNIKKSQMESFEGRLNEGVHFIYRVNDRIVGHCCWVEDYHAIVQEPCLYWHQWVDVSMAKEIRKSIHSQFFSRLLAQPLRAMSGVAVVNHRAIRNCIRNGMRPVLLSVTRFEEGKK